MEIAQQVLTRFQTVDDSLNWGLGQQRPQETASTGLCGVSGRLQ
jgi:hypothetical protein